jgi:predicted transcriptional regulator
LSEEKITVHIKYRDVEQTFVGHVNDVWVVVNKFFSQMIPSFDIAHKVLLTADLQKLIEDFKDVVALAPEGPELLISKRRLTDSEIIQLYLLAAYLGYKLGHLDKDSMSKKALQTRLGKSSKITSTRLGELCREGMAIKTEEGNYKITTIGIKRLQEEVLSKIREKIQV